MNNLLNNSAILKDLVEKYGEKLSIWAKLCETKKCLFCSFPFPEGVVIKKPRDIDTPFLDRIKGDFLFHLKATHGYDPEMFYLMVRNA